MRAVLNTAFSAAVQNASASQAARRRIAPAVVVRGAMGGGEEVDVEPIAVASVVAGNGRKDLIADKPVYKYIDSGNFLVVPAGLTAGSTNEEEFAAMMLHSRTAAQLAAYVTGTAAQRAAFLPPNAVMLGDDGNIYIAGAAVPANVNAARLAPVDYEAAGGKNIGGGDIATDEEFDMLCGRASALAGLNFDFRDIGALQTTADNRWSDENGYPAHPPRGNLHAYTMLSAAALNLGRVNNRPLAAWIRAYALTYGVMPAPGAAVFVEYEFTHDRPTRADAEACSNYARDLPAAVDITQVCANMVAMYGLLHLHKNHTYIPTDGNMNRANDAYIKALRTITDETVVREINEQKATYMRLAVHPFGLAGPYWFAQYMHVHSGLALALAVRHDVTPPPVQRVSIAYAATTEWAALPVGLAINELYGNEIQELEAEMTRIKARIPAYSELYNYYGVADANKGTVSVDAAAAAEALMPMVFGYANVYHTNETGQKDGLALALSLSNVQRDYSAAASMMQDLWMDYKDGALEGGLNRFVERARVAMERARAVGAAANPNPNP